MSVLPCFLCPNQLQERTTKNGKPYFVCDPCGMQIFIRRPAGIGNLKRLLHELKKHQLPLRIHAETLFEMRAIVNELDGLDKEISGLEDRMRLFSANATKKKALALLKKRQQRLLRDLERLTEAGTE